MDNLKILYKVLTTDIDISIGSNLCLQEHSGTTGFNLAKCEEMYEFQRLYAPDREVVIDSQYPEYCYIKPKPRTPPELKRCENTDTDPGLNYENCCPMEEYDMLMLLQKPEVQYIKKHKIELGVFVILSIALIVYIAYLLLRKK